MTTALCEGYWTIDSLWREVEKVTIPFQTARVSKADSVTHITYVLVPGFVSYVKIFRVLVMAVKFFDAGFMVSVRLATGFVESGFRRHEL